MIDLKIGNVLGKEIVSTVRRDSLEPAAKGQSFSSMLKNSIQEVNSLQQEADNAVKTLATGEAENVHSTLIAMEKAGLSFKLMMQMRNKVLDAYREVMRMQV
jgi:flagellar hook-basal body complex protein FliE